MAGESSIISEIKRRLAPIFTVAGLSLSSAATADEPPRLEIWLESAAASWWEANATPEEWMAEGDKLHQALLGAQVRYGVQRALQNKHFLAWMVHCRWVSLFPDDFGRDNYFRELENQRQFSLLGCRPELLSLVAATLLPEDDGARVAEVLCRISAARPGDFDEYLKLAVALAVVGDAAPPEAWPHPYVERGAIPVGDLDPELRFGFYVDAHRGGKLLLDPRELSVRELCFMVDTILELDELRYAQQIKLANPRKLEDLYFAVSYDDGRIQRQQYQWPHGRYRLIDIGKRGGICADQAYFVAQSGKAQGIPTIVFVGQGLSGTHAWVGFLERTGLWEFEAARFRGEKYPVGVAYDPQTWRRVTDAQLVAAQRGGLRAGALPASRRILQWAILNEEAGFFREVVAEARRLMPRSVEAWEMEAAWLAENEPDLGNHAEFWKEWVRAFEQERDLKIRGQKSWLRVLDQLGQTREAERLRQRVVAENRSARFDLGISLAADTVFEKISSGDWAGAQAEYEAVRRRFKRKAGGHLFYNLVEPYVNACLQEGKFKNAEKAVDRLVESFDARRGSILDNDMRKLIASVEGAR